MCAFVGSIWRMTIKLALVLLLAFLAASCSAVQNTPTSYNSERAASPTLAGYPPYNPSSTPSLRTSPTTSAEKYTSFVDLFTNAPQVTFNPLSISDMESLINEIEYYPGRGEGYCFCDGNVEPSTMLLPLRSLYVGVAASHPETIVYQVLGDGGDVIDTGYLKLSEGNEFCNPHYCATLDLPEFVSEHLGNYAIHLTSPSDQSIYVLYDHDSFNLGRREGKLAFSVAVPDKAQVYLDDATMYLINFSNQEFVTIRCYGTNGREQSSNTFRTNREGRLVVNDVACYGGAIIVEGEQSGIFADSVVGLYAKWRPFENCPVSRLHIGDQAHVSFSPPLCSRLRSSPNVETSTVIDCINPGGGMKIIDGPECNNNWIWWKVRTDTGELGWIAEGDGEDFWLDGGEVPYVLFSNR